MKTSYFLIFLALYGFITGGMLLFNPSGSLENLGITSSDKYHFLILEYLGIADIGLSIILLLFRNSNDGQSIRNLLIGSAFIPFPWLVEPFCSTLCQRTKWFYRPSKQV